jgi:replicative DNA helicase
LKKERSHLTQITVDLEEVVLMMIDKKGVDEIIDVLNRQMYSIENHINIFFEAIYKLFENSTN